MSTRPTRRTIALSPKLKTRELIDEARGLLGTDELGRRVPDYAIIHRGVAMLLERIKKEGQP